MRDCQEAVCPIRDCQWAAWDAWSGCSCTCGGGLKRRARTVEVAPRAGGDLCEPSEKSQVEPCNTAALRGLRGWQVDQLEHVVRMCAVISCKLEGIFLHIVWIVMWSCNL